MNNETYEKATELRDTLSVLRRAKHIMYCPYPQFKIFKPKFALVHPSEDLTVNFVSLDKTTREELKDVMITVIEKREREIAEELKQL